MQQRNYLSVCNDMGVPLKDFQESFCGRCLQPECELSLAGRSKFEARVATWEERLFTHPERMPKDDPLYSKIIAKKFVEIQTGPVPEVRGPSEWIDPRAVTEPVLEERPRPASPPPKVEAPPPPDPDPPKIPPTQRTGHPLQTPFQQGAMLSGAPKKASPEKPPEDPWASSPTQPRETDGIKIVSPGAKIRFGGS